MQQIETQTYHPAFLMQNNKNLFLIYTTQKKLKVKGNIW